jgi:hypothetical protein
MRSIKNVGENLKDDHFLLIVFLKIFFFHANKIKDLKQLIVKIFEKY